MARIWVTGARGFLGRHVCRKLVERQDDFCTDRYELLIPDAVENALHYLQPEVVIHLAYPGSQGIQTAVDTPADLASRLIQMDLNVIEACAKAKVKKLVCMGSVCAYPHEAPLPMQEIDLWDGYPGQTNAAFGLAKRTQLMLLQAYREQYGLNGIHLIMANLYGPGDWTQHVIPATIAKVRRAKIDGGPVVVWGRPEVSRSFLYVEDAAEGVVRALDLYDNSEPLNLCAPEEVSMERLVETVANSLHYRGPIEFDRTKAIGHERRVFFLDKMQAALDWSPQTRFADGLYQTIAWHLAEVAP